jgi:tetrathionate reductase subunit B
VTNTIGKCTFCQPRVDAGLAPACVQTCVGGALHFGDANDRDAQVSRMLRERTWVQLTTAEVPGATSHYYYTGGAALPAEVLPRPVAQHLPAQLLGNVVNPAAGLGIGGMVAAFLGAGVKKVIDRRNALAGKKEKNHE